MRLGIALDRGGDRPQTTGPVIPECHKMTAIRGEVGFDDVDGGAQDGLRLVERRSERFQGRGVPETDRVAGQEQAAIAAPGHGELGVAKGEGWLQRLAR